MLLKKLNIIGFGKFNNKELEFKEGINIIYGDNEAGKSTIHSFIDGMFYGFFKPEAKTAIYLEDHEKYRPWNTSKYAGKIEFDFNNKTYEIERVFAKGEESTKVIDGLTGEDITSSLEIGKGKVLQPGLHFFDFNTRVFRNTILIKQLSSKTEDKLANEIREKLINSSQSLDDNISIDKILLELKNKMGDIGTERATSKPYAKNLASLENLYQRKEDILADKIGYNGYLEEKDRLLKELILEEKALKDMDDKLVKLDNLNKAKSFQEARILRDEISMLEEKAVNLSGFRHLSMDSYKEGLALTSRLEFNEKEIEKNVNDILGLNNRIKELDKEVSTNNKVDIHGLEKDFNKFEDLEGEKNQLLYTKEDTNLEFIKRDYESTSQSLSKNKRMKNILILLLGLNILILGFFMIYRSSHLPFSLSLLGIILVLVYFILESNKFEKITKDLEAKILEGERKDLEKKNKIRDLDSRMEKILKSYGKGNKYALKSLLDYLRIETLNKENKLRQLNDLKANRISLEEKLDLAHRDKENSQSKLYAILKDNKVSNLDEFSQGLNKKDLYDKSISDIDYKKDLLARILGERTFEELSDQVQGLEIDLSLRDMDKNQLDYQLTRTRANIQDLKVALSGLEENINILNKKIQDLVEIEEEILRKDDLKNRLEDEYQALDLAHNTIEKLSKEIHSEFAPRLNKNLSKTIERITEGKYNRIRVDEDLNISVENPTTKETIKIDSLSGGTIDQLYFALRFSLTNSLDYGKFPLILDDCFIQYDNIRLKNIIGLLAEVSKERQVIMFSCQKREIDILESLGQDYNLVDLY